jgi:molecular chaperone GrpE
MSDDKTNENMNEEISVDQPVVDQSLEFKDKYMRLLAEFSNYQKQKEEETKSVVKFGNSNLLIKIVDILDDIEMGLMQENLNEETKNILEILKSKMTHLLSLEGVSEIEIKVGDDYDPSKCEVITTTPDEKNKGKVSQIARKGYMISDRVLRTAKVIVGK